MRILVSACLLGYDCKYNGKNNYNSKIVELLKEHKDTKVLHIQGQAIGESFFCARFNVELLLRMTGVGKIVVDDRTDRKCELIVY